MALHVYVFLLVVCLLLSLALLWRLCWLPLRPSSSPGGAKHSTLHRLLKPRTPLDCPSCRLACTPSPSVRPAPSLVRPWCEVKSRRGVQPNSVVDNSDFSPTHLTFPLGRPYSSFSEGNGPSSSFQAKRMLHECTCVSARVLSHLLFGAALYPLLSLLWSCPVESCSQGAHYASTSAQAPQPRRLPRLSSRLHSLVGWRASASGCRVPGLR